MYTTDSGAAIEVPILLPSSWLKLLLTDYPFLLCGGPGHNIHEECKGFWRCYEFFQPGHCIFQKADSDLSTTLPCLVHGDEGRYLKKGNFMICTLETSLGNDPDRKKSQKALALAIQTLFCPGMETSLLAILGMRLSCVRLEWLRSSESMILAMSS